MTFNFALRRKKLMPIGMIFVGLFSVVFLWAPHAQASELDRPVEEIKAAIADAVKCDWVEDQLDPHWPADAIPQPNFECDRNHLSLKDGVFDTLRTFYINPDGIRNPRSATKADREEMIAVVTALLPHWKNARAWMETNMNRTQRCTHYYMGTAKIGDAWVIVATNGINLSECGVTDVFVTRNHGVLKDERLAAGLDEE